MDRDEFLSIWGDPKSYDPTLNELPEWTMKQMIVRKEATIEDIGNDHGIFRLNDGRWTMLSGGWKNPRWPKAKRGKPKNPSRLSRIVSRFRKRNHK